MKIREHAREWQCSVSFLLRRNKMQATHPFPPPGELDEKYANLILTHLLHYVKKQEVHNTVHCRHRIDPRPRVTCTENLGEIYVIF